MDANMILFLHIIYCTSKDWKQELYLLQLSAWDNKNVFFKNVLQILAWVIVIQV